MFVFLQEGCACHRGRSMMQVIELRMELRSLNQGHVSQCICVCVCACVRACVRSCVRVCMIGNAKFLNDLPVLKNL